MELKHQKGFIILCILSSVLFLLTVSVIAPPPAPPPLPGGPAEPREPGSLTEPPALDSEPAEPPALGDEEPAPGSEEDLPAEPPSLDGQDTGDETGDGTSPDDPTTDDVGDGVDGDDPSPDDDGDTTGGSPGGSPGGRRHIFMRNETRSPREEGTVPPIADGDGTEPLLGSDIPIGGDAPLKTISGALKSAIEPFLETPKSTWWLYLLIIIGAVLIILSGIYVWYRYSHRTKKPVSPTIQEAVEFPPVEITETSGSGIEEKLGAEQNAPVEIPEQYKQTLFPFITESIQHGYDKLVIREALLKRGWDSSMIDAALNQF